MGVPTPQSLGMGGTKESQLCRVMHPVAATLSFRVQSRMSAGFAELSTTMVKVTRSPTDGFWPGSSVFTVARSGFDDATLMHACGVLKLLVPLASV